MAKRKKRRKGGKYVVGAACVAAIIGLAGFWDFNGFGLGDSWGFDGIIGDSNDSGSSANDDDANDNGGGNAAADENGDASNDAPTQVVVVSGDTISHNGVEVSLNELSTIISNYSGAAWELRDDGAIAATHDDVEAMLLDHGVDFTRTSN